GVILYQMLTGHRPFGGTEFALMHDVVKTPPPPFSAVNPDHGVPAELEQIVRRCLAKSPEDRFQTADELAAAFRECITTIWPSSAPPGPSGRPPGFAPAPLSGYTDLGPASTGPGSSGPGFETTGDAVEYLAEPETEPSSGQRS